MTHHDQPPAGQAYLCGDITVPLLEETIPALLARCVAANPEGEAVVFAESGQRLT